MDVLDFLKSIRHKRIELAAIKSYEEDLRLSLLPSGIRYDLDKVQTSPTDRMLEMVAKLTDMQERETDQKEALIADIELAERMVDSTHARARMHGSAIAEIRSIWGKYEKDRPGQQNTDPS